MSTSLLFSDPNTLLSHVMEIEGALGTTLISMVEQTPICYQGDLNLEPSINGIIKLVVHNAMIAGGLEIVEPVADVVFTYDHQLHIANPIYANGTLIFTVFDASKVNLAIARRGLQQLVAQVPPPADAITTPRPLG